MPSRFAAAMESLEVRILDFLEKNGPHTRNGIQRGVRAKRERVFWALENLTNNRKVEDAWGPHTDTLGRPIFAHLFYAIPRAGTRVSQATPVPL